MPLAIQSQPQTHPLPPPHHPPRHGPSLAEPRLPPSCHPRQHISEFMGVCWSEHHPGHPSGGFLRVWGARLGPRSPCPPGKHGRALLRRMCVCTRMHTRLCVLEGFGCTSARRPPGSWWGQKVLTGKTMAKREIQLVQGLVPISQPLNAKGAERMGGRGRAFLLHFSLSFWGAFWPLLSPQHRALKESLGLHICHIHLRRCGWRERVGWWAQAALLSPSLEAHCSLCLPQGSL